jgi:hypothetical protein
MKLASCAAPWISGAAGIIVTTPPAAARSGTSSGVAAGRAVGKPPPMPAKKRSSWRHITPLGMPVVPPV